MLRPVQRMIVDYTPEHYLQPNERLGPYRIESLLGQGGVAAVYAAWNQQNQLVALKTLYPQAASNPNIRRLFQQEYRTLARLKHPGIIRVTDSGVLQGRLFIAMDIVEGQTLEEFLTKNKRIGEVAALDITRRIADALDYLHERGLVHRDIKPSNVMMSGHGRTILFDFGTALNLYDEEEKDEQAGSVYGTPAYVPPEQAQGRTDIDGRADLYSLGAILYRMVTGQKPFYGTRDEVLHAHIHTMPEPPSSLAYVSSDLEAVIMKALAKAPAERFQSGAEFIDALAAVEPAVEEPSLPDRILRWFRQPASA